MRPLAARAVAIMIPIAKPVLDEAEAALPQPGAKVAIFIGGLERLLRVSFDVSDDIRPVSELQEISLHGRSREDVVAYIIEDPQIRNWPDARTEGPLSPKLPYCMVAFGQLEPRAHGPGRSVLAARRSAMSSLPAPNAATAPRAIDPSWRVEPAQVYAVTPGGARDARTAAASRWAPLSRETS